VRHRAAFLLGAFLVPGAALAADGDTLDLKGGAVGELTAKTLALAYGLLAFLVVLGLVVELLRGPGQRRRYLSVVWRTLLVFGLLQAYTFLAGSVVKQCTSLAQGLSSQSAGEAPLQQYLRAVERSFPEAFGPKSAGTSPPATPGVGPPPFQGSDGPGLGGLVFGTVVELLKVVSFAINWVFTELSRVLIAFFYAIGPLALVFHVPGLDAPGRWFRSLVTVSCWPLVSSLLLQLSAAVLSRVSLPASSAGAAFGGVASALLLVVLAFATPRIASALVGGVGNLLGEGASVAFAAAGSAVGVVR
jgi:hypothetical protein